VRNKFNKNLSFSSTAVETLQAAAKLRPKMYASEREVKYKNASLGAAGALLLPAIFIGPYSLHVGRGRSAKIDLSKRVI
jgi:hypothetical protein